MEEEYRNNVRLVVMGIPPPHLNTNLELLENEEFKDCQDYAGYYSVSDYGRVRSEGRVLINNKTIKTRILKQAISKQNQATLIFSVDGIRETKNVQTLVYESFMPERDLATHRVAHKNKTKYDNRLVNLEIMTTSDSIKLDYKLGKNFDNGIAERGKLTRWTTDHNGSKIKFIDYEKLYHIKVNGILKLILCKGCGQKKTLEKFYRRKSGGYRHKCIDCTIRSMGVKSVGKLKANKILAEKGFRHCSVCKELKPLSEFNKNKGCSLGKSFNCRSCVKILNHKYNSRRKNNTLKELAS